MIARLALALLAATSLSGCIARAAYDVGTAPIRATSKLVDWSTTSRSEADRNRGRRLRKECAREQSEARRQAKASGTVQPPPSAACR